MDTATPALDHKSGTDREAVWQTHADERAVDELIEDELIALMGTLLGSNPPQGRNARQPRPFRDAAAKRPDSCGLMWTAF